MGRKTKERSKERDCRLQLVRQAMTSVHGKFRLTRRECPFVRLSRPAVLPAVCDWRLAPRPRAFKVLAACTRQLARPPTRPARATRSALGPFGVSSSPSMRGPAEARPVLAWRELSAGNAARTLACSLQEAGPLNVTDSSWLRVLLSA